MPHYKKPPTLLCASLTSLASSVLKSARNVVSVDMDCDIIREFVSEIPRMFADDYVVVLLRLIMQLPTEDQTKRLLSIVLHPKCKRLDMKTSIFKKFNRKAVIANLDRLPELKYFILSNISDEHIMRILDLHIDELHFHELYYLEVIKLISICTSTILRTVVNNCPLLSRIQAHFEQLEKGDFQLLSNLKYLQYVSITSMKEKVLPEDIALLICRLPALTYILYDKIYDVIHVLKKWHQEGKVAPPFQVREFGWGSISSNELDSLCAYFPLIESVEIHDPADSITSLINLHDLKRLTLRSTEADVVIQLMLNINSKLEQLYLKSIFSFQDIFKSGNQIQLGTLKVLQLSECKEVDLVEINSCLPNLETLKLYRCVGIPHNRYWIHNAPKAFSELKHLAIFGSVFDSSDLQYLLSGCKDLTNLGIHTYVHHWPDSPRFVINDDLWIQLSETNPLKKLRHLTISSDFLTRKVIPKMIESMDELESLCLIGRQWSDELSQSEAQKLLEFLSPYDIKITVADLHAQHRIVFSYNIRQ